LDGVADLHLELVDCLVNAAHVVVELRGVGGSLGRSGVRRGEIACLDWGVSLLGDLLSLRVHVVLCLLYHIIVAIQSEFRDNMPDCRGETLGDECEFGELLLSLGKSGFILGE
jgi:hypothetical protein